MRQLPDGRIRDFPNTELREGDKVGMAIRVDGSWSGEWRATVIRTFPESKLTVNGVDILSPYISIGTIYSRVLPET